MMNSWKTAKYKQKFKNSGNNKELGTKVVPNSILFVLGDIGAVVEWALIR